MVAFLGFVAQHIATGKARTPQSLYRPGQLELERISILCAPRAQRVGQPSARRGECAAS